MCYASPGPRCAAHVGRQLQTAQNRAQEVEHEITGLVQQGSTGDAQAASAALSRMLELSEERLSAQREVARLNEEFDETRTGQKALIDQISATSDPDEERDLQARLQAAKARRRVKMDAYHAAYPHGAPNVSHRRPADSPSGFDATEVKDEVTVNGQRFYRVRPNVNGAEPYSIRIQTNRALSDDEVQHLAGLTGYAYRETVAGESIGNPVRDSPNSFVVYADTTKSRRSDLGIALQEFEETLPERASEGSPVRSTNQAGPNTQGTRLLDGMGDDLKVEIYYDSVDQFNPDTGRYDTKN